jgi:hypothetical protein
MMIYKITVFTCDVDPVINFPELSKAGGILESKSKICIVIPCMLITPEMNRIINNTIHAQNTLFTTGRPIAQSALVHVQDKRSAEAPTIAIKALNWSCTDDQ